MYLNLRFRKEGLTERFCVALPRSKSIAARALMMKYVSGGTTRLVGVPECDDSQYLMAALDRVAGDVGPLPLRCREAASGLPVAHRKLSVDLGLGGTSLRFFTALAASIPAADIAVDCAPALRRRPFRPLAEALQRVGGVLRFDNMPDYPPFHAAGRLIEGGVLEVDGSVSSQFASALMLVAPSWRKGLELSLTGRPVSLPYLRMTAEVMRGFGVMVDVDGNKVVIPPGFPQAPEEYVIESDWSAAGFFYELALMQPELPIRLESLTPPDSSLQGDSMTAAIFGYLGVETEFFPDGSAMIRGDKRKIELLRSQNVVIELDMISTPDLVPALAVALCFAGLKFRLTGVANLRHKESNRLAAIATEMEKVGFAVDVEEDAISWKGRRLPVGEGESIATYNDHRIAMAFAMAASRLPYLAIEDPLVVDKSFPGFWNQINPLFDF